MGKVLAWTFFFADEFVFVLLAVLKLVSLKKDTDIIHAHQIHWIAFCGTMTSKITRKPLLVKDATLSGFRELKMMPCSRAMKRSIIKTACFAAVSADIKVSLLHEGVNTNRIFLTPNGVLLPSHTNRYLETGFDILFVGNFIQGRIKGLDILLHSFAMVLAKYPQSRLFILGEGDPTAYARILTEHDIPPYCCEFLGIRDVAHYYMNCTVFVLPSRSEGMSNALLEAMGYGMACISTDVSGSKDIITNGQNGMLVERENIAQLADALLFLFSNKELAFQMGRKARDTVIEHYQIDKIAQNYAGIYKQILEEYND
jgi:glycosyltransferase involved in cell wall biosynthesis